MYLILILNTFICYYSNYNCNYNNNKNNNVLFLQLISL